MKNSPQNQLGFGSSIRSRLSPQLNQGMQVTKNLNQKSVNKFESLMGSPSQQSLQKLKNSKNLLSNRRSPPLPSYMQKVSINKLTLTSLNSLSNLKQSPQGYQNSSRVGYMPVKKQVNFDTSSSQNNRMKSKAVIPKRHDTPQKGSKSGGCSRCSSRSAFGSSTREFDQVCQTQYYQGRSSPIIDINQTLQRQEKRSINSNIVSQRSTSRQSKKCGIGQKRSPQTKASSKSRNQILQNKTFNATQSQLKNAAGIFKSQNLQMASNKHNHQVPKAILNISQPRSKIANQNNQGNQNQYGSRNSSNQSQNLQIPQRGTVVYRRLSQEQRMNQIHNNVETHQRRRESEFKKLQEHQFSQRSSSKKRKQAALQKCVSQNSIRSPISNAGARKTSPRKGLRAPSNQSGSKTRLGGILSNHHTTKKANPVTQTRKHPQYLNTVAYGDDLPKYDLNAILDSQDKSQSIFQATFSPSKKSSGKVQQTLRKHTVQNTNETINEENHVEELGQSINSNKCINIKITSNGKHARTNESEFDANISSHVFNENQIHNNERLRGPPSQSLKSMTGVNKLHSYSPRVNLSQLQNMHREKFQQKMNTKNIILNNLKGNTVAENDRPFQIQSQVQPTQHIGILKKKPSLQKNRSLDINMDQITRMQYEDMYKQKAANVVKSKMQAKYINHSIGISAGNLLNQNIQSNSHVKRQDFQYATQSMSSLNSPQIISNSHVTTRLTTQQNAMQSKLGTRQNSVSQGSNKNDPHQFSSPRIKKPLLSDISQLALQFKQLCQQEERQQVSERASLNFQKQFVKLLTEKQSQQRMDEFLLQPCFEIPSASQVNPYPLETKTEENVTTDLTQSPFKDSLTIPIIVGPNFENDIEFQERGGITREKVNLIQYLSFMGKMEIVFDAVIRKKKKIINYTSQIFGNSALHLSCRNLQKKSVEKLLLARAEVNFQNKSDLDTPLHILIKLYEALKIQNLQGCIDELDQIEIIIQLILPFCDKSLQINNRSGKTPIQLIKSPDLKQIFQDFFDENYDGSIEESTIKNIEAPATQSENSPNQPPKKNSSGSDDDPQDIFDEFNQDEKINNTKSSNQERQSIINALNTESADGMRQNQSLQQAQAKASATQSQKAQNKFNQEHSFRKMDHIEEERGERSEEIKTPMGNRGTTGKSSNNQEELKMSPSEKANVTMTAQKNQNFDKTPTQRSAYLSENFNETNQISSLKQNIRKLQLSEAKERELNGRSMNSQSNKQSFVDDKDQARKQSPKKKAPGPCPEDFVAHQLLGTGSFGEVFLVEEKKTKQLYAMKVLSKQKIRDQNLLKYAFAERAIMKKMTEIDHPFIVKIKYAFQTTESLFMVIQFCSGGDLSQYLELEGQFTEKKARIYISEMICAIESLHENNIIFRDLKPDNIVLDQEGHALLTDFGLSRQGIKGEFKGADSFCGSYAYLAPEMVSKKGHGKAVDWYLIGVVLYELLTGLPPFYDDDKEVLFKNITHNKLEFPSSSELQLTANCKDLLSKLLKKDPQNRLGFVNGISDIKSHPWFSEIDWDKLKLRQGPKPEKAYLSDMAMKIIENQPYMLKDHHKTKGQVSQQSDPGYIPGWELSLDVTFN